MLNDGAAQQQAVAFTSEVLKDKPEELWNKEQWLGVTDDANRLLFTVITLTVTAPHLVK